MSKLMMSKATEQDLEAAMILTGMLEDVENGYLPRKEDGEEDDSSEGYRFDPNDRDHLELFHQRVMAANDKTSLFRVVFGFATVLSKENDIFDQNVGHLALSPRLVKAIEDAQRLGPALELLEKVRKQTRDIRLRRRIATILGRKGGAA